ncbi:MAG: GldG family protein [Oscillospiraceae bacterium]|nr:GldG family protein [Oscillospiraceae bacterium]
MKINKKKLKYGTAAVVITAVVVAIVVLLNVVLSVLSESYNMNFDLTPNSDFEITQETKDYLATLTENVEICTTVDELVFKTSENRYYRQAYEVLKKYEYNSDKITVNFVDMTTDPTYVEKYKQYYDGTINDSSIIIFNEDTKRIRVLSTSDLFNTEVNYYYFTEEIVSSKAEQTLTSAIMYITDPEPKTAVYLNVTTQSAVGENVQSLLQANGFDLVTVDPLTEELPMDADLMVLNAPMNDLAPEVIDKLYSFMENGGNYGKNMIYLASMEQNDTPNIDAFLAEWGIAVKKGVVSDNNEQNLDPNYYGYGFGSFIEENDYTTGIPAENMEAPVVSYYARPIELLFDFSGNVSVISLLNTAETGVAITAEMQQEYADTGVMPEIQEQAIPMIALSNKYTFIENEQVLSNLVVFGSDQMLRSDITSATYYNNGDYFVSILNKISGKENGIYIVEKDLSGDTFQVTEAQVNTLRVVIMFVLPAAVAVVGIVVWLKRRHK